MENLGAGHYISNDISDEELLKVFESITDSESSEISKKTQRIMNQFEFME